jgi:molybdopterin synthase catalytic subunit
MTYLTDEAIDMNALAREVMRRSDGALVTFEGAVRDHNEGRAVDEIIYEAYRPMAEREFARVIGEITAKYPAVSMAVVHRLGLLRVGDVSIGIACASPHRAEAFEACRLLIDRIKETVPIWKKERGPDGDEWVGWQVGCAHPHEEQKAR